MSTHARRIAVIGGLAAGPSAASKAARVNPDAIVTLFEQGQHVSYGICEIPYYIAGEVPEPALTPFSPDRLRAEKRIDVRVLHRVEEIRPTQRTMVVRNLATGRMLEEEYDRLVIATGSRPRSAGLPGEESRNVFRVNSLDGGYAVKRFLAQEHPRSAVIIGGGYIGMEMADALVSNGLAVTLLHQHSLPLAGLERDTRERVRSTLEAHGVHFAGMARVEGFVEGPQQKVTHVVTTDGHYDADMVIMCIGVEPATELARETGVRLGSHRGIVTDQKQLTNLDGIYAAGDCCEIRNLVTQRPAYIPLATNASKAGWVAGENAAGGNALFRGAIHSIAVRVFDLQVARVGISAEEARGAGFDVVTDAITAPAKVASMPGSTRLTVHTIADRKSGRLLGANVYGADGVVPRANTLAVAIQHQIPVAEIGSWDLIYAPPFAPLWDPVLVAAHSLIKKL